MFLSFTIRCSLLNKYYSTFDQLESEQQYGQSHYNPAIFVSHHNLLEHGMMTTIHYYNRTFQCDENQTVLDVLLKNGQDILYSCTSGVCATCVMQIVEGDIPPRAQAGLRSSLVEKGHFLPCVCQPTSDLHIRRIDPNYLYSPAKVHDVDHLSNDICRIFLETATPLYYHAGQHMNLRRKDGLARSYSLSSLPNQDNLLEFHIKRLKNGQMSNWIMNDLSPGHLVDIQGPLGNCFYPPEKQDQNMLLIGNGTGLAPLLGIAKDALASGHRGQIHLYHGSSTVTGLYLGTELRTLDASHSNFHYVPCSSSEQGPRQYRHGRADDIAFSEQEDLRGWCVFICGLPQMVYEAKNRAKGCGVAINDIYTDPYERKELRKKTRV